MRYYNLSPDFDTDGINVKFSSKKRHQVFVHIGIRNEKAYVVLVTCGSSGGYTRSDYLTPDAADELAKALVYKASETRAKRTKALEQNASV